MANAKEVNTLSEIPQVERTSNMTQITAFQPDAIRQDQIVEEIKVTDTIKDQKNDKPIEQK